MRSVKLRDARLAAVNHIIRTRAGQTDPFIQRRVHDTTLNDVLDHYFDHRAPERFTNGTLSKNTIRTYRSYAATVLRPALGRMKLASIRKAHIEHAVSNLSNSKRNLVLNFLSTIYRLAAKWELLPSNHNPTPTDRVRISARDRTLTESEIKRLVHAIDRHGSRYRVATAAIEFALVTGLRIGEVAAIRWQDVNTHDLRLFLPETKTGARTHDLPPEAMDILHRMPQTSTFAFPGKRSAKVSHSHLHQVFNLLRQDAGIPDARIHDLRHFCYTPLSTGCLKSYNRLLFHYFFSDSESHYFQSGPFRNHIGTGVNSMLDATWHVYWVIPPILACVRTPHVRFGHGRTDEIKALSESQRGRNGGTRTYHRLPHHRHPLNEQLLSPSPSSIPDSPDPSTVIGPASSCRSAPIPQTGSSATVAVKHIRLHVGQDLCHELWI